MAEDDAPDAMCCPISKSLMKDPVVASDGHTYERGEIVNWFRTRQTSPMTNQSVSNCQLIPNITLKKMITDWKEKKASVVRENGNSTWHCSKRNTQVRRDFAFILCECENCVAQGQTRITKCLQKGNELRAALNSNAQELSQLMQEDERRKTLLLEALTNERSQLLKLTVIRDDLERELKRDEVFRRHRDEMRRKQEAEDGRVRAQEQERLRREQEAKAREEQERVQEVQRQEREIERREEQRFWFDNFVDVNNSEFRCVLCNVREHINNGTQMRRHVLGVRHINVANSYRQSDSRYYCRACDCFASSAHCFMEHLGGIRHRNNTCPSSESGSNSQDNERSSYRSYGSEY